VEQPVILSNTQ